MTNAFIRIGFSAALMLGASAFAGCAASPNAAEKIATEEDAPLDGAYDSFRAPTLVGDLTFGRAERSELTASARYLAWNFSLTAGSAVTVHTDFAMSGGREVDTVLYLYREGPRGWGSYIAVNDDSRGTLFSGLSRTLEAGNYRVIVKGYAATTRGAFSITADCTGDGCGPAQHECVFGERFGDLAPRMSSYASSYTTADGLSAIQTQQIIASMHIARHPEVTNIEDALALTRMGSAPELGLERSELYDTLGGRAYTAWRFVLGDRFWGAIFDQGTTNVATPIVDDVFEGCTQGPGVCVLGVSFNDFRMLPVVSDTILRSSTGISATRRAQMVRAVRETRPEITNITQAFASVDGGEINERVRRDAVSGRTFTAYEYGAGDSSYGAIFEGTSNVPVGLIRDGDMYGCTVLR